MKKNLRAKKLMIGTSGVQETQNISFVINEDPAETSKIQVNS